MVASRCICNVVVDCGCSLQVRIFLDLGVTVVLCGHCCVALSLSDALGSGSTVAQCSWCFSAGAKPRCECRSADRFCSCRWAVLE